MIELILIATVLALVAGIIVKLVLEHIRTPERITWLEFAIGAVVITVLIGPIAGCTGWNVAKSNAVSYNEYWNGWETAAREDKIQCTVNGSCEYEFSCNCEWVKKCIARDDDGNCTSEIYVEECDDCPYFAFERDLSIETTLGRYYVAHRAPENFRSAMKTNSLPSGFGKSDYETPQLWLDCKARIDNGNPGPVTKRMTYENYIYASDTTILKEYSDLVEELKQQKLLPNVQSGIHTLYQADKVSFVGYTPADPAAWQQSLSYLNAGLGTELQGDLHLVITQNETISQNPDGYLTALKAYWINSQKWGKNTISKNSIIVVVGTKDGATVDWARAITGMPLGNERMLLEIRNNLPGVELTPERLMGTSRGEFYQEETEKGKRLRVRSIHGSGVLERALWGVDEPSTKFVRVSMTARDKDDVGGGFLYLSSEIEPTTGQKVTIVIVIFFLSCPVWAGMALAEIGIKKTYDRRYGGKNNRSRDW